MWRKLILFVSFLVVAGSAAQAGMYLWNGSAGDGLWDTPANWTVTDSLWTWPNEEAVADPNINDKYTNSDTIAIDIIGATVTRTGPLAIQGKPDGSTTAVLTLDGTSLTMDARLATSTDAGNAGRGEINILNGSTVTITGDGEDLTIADDNGNWGLLNVVDSTIIIPDDLRTDDGESHVSISGSSVLNCDDFAISQSGNSLSFVDIGGTTVITIVDDFDLSNGVSFVTIGGDATVTFGDDLYVPDDDNAVATLTITDNAVFNIGDDVNIGDNPGSVGHMIITGNATVNAPDEIYIADDVSAEGIMDVNGTATLIVGDDLQVGDAGLGICNVGENAKIDIVDDLRVGADSGSEGLMTIGGNSTVNVADELYIGDQADTKGTLNVNGSATLNVVDDIDVGDDGPGTLNVSENATLNIEDSIKISENGGEGHVTVSGNATINNGDDIEPGCSPNGLGTMDIGENATVNLGDDFELGVDPGCQGQLTIGGSASVTCDDMLVGVSLESITSLTINGGKTIVRDDVIMGSGDGDPSIGQSRVFMNGGLLQAEDLDIRITDAKIIFTDGQIRLNNANVSEDDIRGMIADGTIVVTGEESVDYYIFSAGSYTVLSGPPVKAWIPEPADGATGVSYAPPIVTYVSSDVPKPVPDRNFIPPGTTVLGEAVSVLNVPDSFKVNDLNIELDITVSGQNADYNVYLKDPGGRQITLFEDIGAGSGFTNTILDDEASTTIGGKRDPFTGRFKAKDRLSRFDGRNAQGTWQLKIVDDWYGGSATLNSWQLVIEQPPLVSWRPAIKAASQKVYFSDKLEDVSNAAAKALAGSVAGDVSSIRVGTFALGKTYYWRVDAVDPNGTPLPAGDVWSFTTAFGNAEASVRVAAGTDDAEEAVNPGFQDAYNSSSDLEILDDNTDNGGRQYIGMNFRGIAIPPGTDVTDAYIEFVCDETEDGTEDAFLLIWGHLALNPDGFAGPLEPNAISARPMTEAKVPWAPEQWTEVGQVSQTSNISSIIEEIINQNGWASGNAIEIIIGEDTSQGPFIGSRTAESYDGSASQAPLLHIVGLAEAPQRPFPADGAVNVPLETVLSWEPGFHAVMRNVYFSTNTSPKSVGMTTGVTLAPELKPGTTYYWKVQEIEANGTKHTGAVWSFTTVPAEATEPDPADGATGVPADVILGWQPGVWAVSHDVYFGTSSPPPFIGNQAEASYDPGGLRLTGTFYWQVDEIDADGTKHIGEVWSFSTLSGQASQPDPADGAVLEQTYALLGWTAGPTAASHDVYISDNLDDVTSGAEAAFAGNQTETTLSVGVPGVPVPDGLVPGGTYYWRVDEVEADPNVVHVGAVWSFSVLSDKAHNPIPADGAVDVATSVQLSWSPGLAAVLHSVYFGDDPDVVANATGAPPLPLTTYDPGTLEPGKTYYWRVDEFNPPVTVTGDVWSFTTAP